MGNSLSVILVIALLVVSLYSIYSITEKQEDEDTVTVSGSSTADVNPDQAELFLRIEKIANDPKQAQSSLTEVSNKVINVLKEEGLTDKEIETINYNLEKYQVWEDEKMVDKGYKASYTLKLTVKDIATIGDYLDLAVNSGVNNVESLRFTLSKEKEKDVKSGLLGSATENAKLKAETLAKSLNERLGDVVSVTESSDGFVPYYYAESAMLKSDAPVIQPKSISLTVSVTAVFELN